MSDIEIYRIRTRMLVYAIETGIISYIRPLVEMSDGEFEGLMFGEILQQFSKIKTQKHEDDIRQQLKNMSDVIELASIRNACSHTVREFHIYYWYRAAAFAIDPRFRLLGIKEPSESIACVESGQISDPPEEWLEKIKIPEIANNLPDDEQFERTGLIGRNKEIDSVINDIKGGRNNTIALVGPGGVGKTSLAVEIARKLKDKYLNRSNLDAIVYLTLKKEYLTVDGIKRKTQEEIFNNIEQYFLGELSELYQIPDVSFETMKDFLEKDNLLIILDNLEDLIVEDIQAYEGFIEKLPATWKVLITSRISIDGAKNVPISALSDGAIRELARKYYAVVSGKEFDDATLEKISNSCSGNPLALKLVIDRFNLGHSIEDSKSIALNEILNFSFGSLINTLGIEQKKVLESIFIADSASKHLISELTKLSSDNIAEVISRLQKTSLIERQQNEFGEVYKISSAVRDLLASSPLSYELRTEYATLYSQLRLKESAKKIEDRISINYFEPKTPQEFENKFQQVSRIWSKHFKSTKRMEMPESVRRQISNFDVMLTNSETEFKKYSDYHRTRAYSRSLLHDITGALDYAKKAYDLAPDSLPAAYTLATLHLANKSEANSRDILRPFVIQLLDSTLTKSSLDDIFDTYLMRDTFATFFKAATWSGLSNEVIDLTKVWKEVPGDLKGTFVFSRATALRRAHEATRPDHPDRQRDLLEAARLLKFALIELERPPKFLKGEVVNIYNEINYTIENNLVAPEFENEIKLAFKSLAGMISLVEQNSHSIDLESQDTESINIQKDMASVDKLGVEVYATKPTYAYARDVIGNAYFVPLASFNTKMTVVLKVGQKIKIWGYEENEIKNGSRKANFASF